MRVTVILNENEARALQRAANFDLRHPRDQARAILRDALERAGHLPQPTTASEAARERPADRIRDALDCLPRALDGSQPFSMGQRAEVMLAIESLRAALAAASEEG
jgi:hypothetical protein